MDRIREGSGSPGLKPMSLEICGEYHTRSGEVGAKITRMISRGRVTYNWTGKSETDMARNVAYFHERKRGMRVVQEWAP